MWTVTDVMEDRMFGSRSERYKNTIEDAVPKKKKKKA